MTLITVPTKGPTDELSNSEFNQFLEALKDGTRDIRTLNIEASTGLFTGDVDFTGTVTINGQEGPYAEYFESANSVYISTTGGPYDGVNYDGKSPGKALNSFQNAIDNIVAIHGALPTENDGVSLVSFDSAVYDEALVCIDYVDVYAPNAVLKLGGVSENQLIIANNKVLFNKIYREDGSNDMIIGANTAGVSILSANRVVDNGTGAAIRATTNHPIYVRATELEVAGGGTGVCDCGTSGGHLHLNISSIHLFSDNAVGIHVTGPSEIHGNIDEIEYHEYTVTGTKGLLIEDGHINLNIGHLRAETSYEITAPGILSMYLGQMDGTPVINSGTVDVVTPASINTGLENIDQKEDSLGNPASDGWALTSTTTGTRSWAATGDMSASVYDPQGLATNAFKHENMSGEYVDIDTPTGPITNTAGRLAWNPIDETMDVMNGTNIWQVNQEFVFRVHNNGPGTLYNGKVVHPLGTYSVDGFPQIEYASAKDHTDLITSIGVLTTDIAPGGYGFATTKGKVRSLDTGALSLGRVWLSDAVPGDLTNIKPEFPSYEVFVGGVTKTGLNGELVIDINNDPWNTTNNYYNATMRENFDFLVSASPTVITGSLERSGGGELTMIFSDGMHIFDSDPAETIQLIPGTDTVPVKNLIYIPISTKTLTVSTVDWPAEEHIRIADVVLQSALNTQNYEALKNRNWNDHIQGTDDTGGHAHIGRWIRNRPASWHSGVEASLDFTTPSSMFFSCTSGKIYQKHIHTFNAFDQALGTPIFMVNDPTTAYSLSSDLGNELLDATGASLNGRRYNLILWGVANKTGEIDQIMCNLPIGSYINNDDAIADIANFDVYTIPKEFEGSGFLIAKFTIRHTSPADTFELLNVVDLRGQFPGTSAGGGISAGATSFLGLDDTPGSYVGNAGDVPVVNGTETGLEFLNGVNGSFTSADGKTITVTNGIITAIV